MEEKKEIGIRAPLPEIDPLKDVTIIGAGHVGVGKSSLIQVEAAIRMMAEGKKVIVITGDTTPNIDLSKIDLDSISIPVLKKISEFPSPVIYDHDTPNKLEMLRNLKLSPEQIDYFQNSPPQRLEGEKQEDYKTRRMLNKLIIKYRGQF
jgi:hypothetical protein